MALFSFMKSSTIPSLLPQFPSSSKTELSDRSSSFKLNSLSTANKWAIVADDRAPSSPTTPFTNFDHIEGEIKLYKTALKNVGDNSAKGLYLVDAMQRLNIDHYFQQEIQDFLAAQYSIFSSYSSGHGDNLHELSLLFRLLRQQGHYVPAEVFERFTGKEGKFLREKVRGDIRGVIDLYEASQIRMEGEDILEEAENFSGRMLKEIISTYSSNSNNNNGVIDKVEFLKSTLEQPFHKSLPIFTSRNLFHATHTLNGWVNALQHLAKINFNMLQTTYQKETLDTSKWWGELGLAKELKYARNQPLKWYIWSIPCLSDPSLSEERLYLTKAISFIYILDDVFDIYGTVQELSLFTKAVTRWEIEGIEDLPDYMKICFKALYDLTNEISYKVSLKHGWDPILSLRKAWVSLCEAFLVEAEWFGSGKVPSAEEYLENGLVSSGVHIALIHIFFLLGKSINKESVHKIDNSPTIISSTATILRLWDDLGSAEDENQDGKDGSYIECAMKKEKMNRERAREVVMSKISDAWMSLNRETILGNNSFGLPYTKACLNLARMVPLMYNYDNTQSLPKLEAHVKSLLYDHVLL